MATNNCGTLNSADLSSISVALSNYRYATQKLNKDATDALKQLKAEGESDIVIENVTILTNQATEVFNDRIKRIGETEKKITECIRG